MIEVPVFINQRRYEHEAMCVAAIRERKRREALAEADFEYRPWWRPRGDGGRFAPKGRA